MGDADKVVACCVSVGRRWRAAVNVAQCVQHPNRVRVGEPVADGLSIAPRGDKALGAHLGEMLRSPRTRQLRMFGQIAHGCFPLDQPAKQQKSLFAGEKLQQAGGRLRTGFQFAEIRKHYIYNALPAR